MDGLRPLPRAQFRPTPVVEVGVGSAYRPVDVLHRGLGDLVDDLLGGRVLDIGDPTAHAVGSLPVDPQSPAHHASLERRGGRGTRCESGASGYRGGMGGPIDVDEAVAYAAGALSALADPTGAAGMAAYLKTAMPFYGVKTPQRVPIGREVSRRWPPSTPDDYARLVTAFWDRPHREMKYLAIGLAGRHASFVTGAALPLYQRMIVAGAWWDLVDGIASDLVGTVLRRERATTTPVIRRWIEDDDLWLRRTAIICQLGHKGETDTSLLFDACRARAHEPEFFIRKAIGWALRQYARTDPDAVRAFLAEQGDRLSPLSRREAAKHL